MTVGENLRALRQGKALTQEQAAEALGVTRQTVSSYESGRTQPDIQMLLRLCQLYGTDLNGIVYGQGPALRPLRWGRRAAAAFLALLTVLGLGRALTLWAADRFFPVEPGILPPESAALWQRRSELMTLWTELDAALLWAAVLGALGILLWGRRRAPDGRSGLRCLLFLAAGQAAVLPFALTDPVFSPVDYLGTPLLAVLLLAGALGLCRVLDRLADRPRRIT